MSAEDFVYDEGRNSWSPGATRLSGESYLRVTLAERGRLAIRHLNGGRSPIVLMSGWTGPEFVVRLYGELPGRVMIETTSKPVEVELVGI